MVTFEQIESAIAQDNYIGFCASCGEEHSNCEPDMQKEKCQACGKFEVYGAEQLLIAGKYDDEEPKPSPAIGTPVFKRTTRTTSTTKKPRIPSIQQLLTGKEQSPGIKEYAREILMNSGFLIHTGAMVIRIHEPIESIVSDSVDRRVKQINRIWNEPHDDSEELGPGDFVTINENQCRRMIGKRTETRIATVNELYRRAEEKHGNVYRWFRSVAIGDAETKTPNSIIGFNTAGERVAIIACVIDEE